MQNNSTYILIFFFFALSGHCQNLLVAKVGMSPAKSKKAVTPRTLCFANFFRTYYTSLNTNWIYTSGRNGRASVSFTCKSDLESNMVSSSGVLPTGCICTCIFIL